MNNRTPGKDPYQITTRSVSRRASEIHWEDFLNEPSRQHPVEQMIHTFQYRHPPNENVPPPMIQTRHDEDVEEAARELAKREKNRLAAKESRIKKKQQFQQMEQEILLLRQENERLQEQLSEYRKVFGDLRSPKRKAHQSPEQKLVEEARQEMEILSEFLKYS